MTEYLLTLTEFGTVSLKEHYLVLVTKYGTVPQTCFSSEYGAVPLTECLQGGSSNVYGTTPLDSDTVALLRAENGLAFLRTGVRYGSSDGVRSGSSDGGTRDDTAEGAQPMRLGYAPRRSCQSYRE